MSATDALHTAFDGIVCTPSAAPHLRIGRQEHLFHEGDPADAIFVVLSGVVVIYRTGLDGNRLIHGLRFAGELVGVGYGETFGVSAVAVRPSVVRRVSRASLERLIDEDHAAVRQILKVLTAELMRTSDQLMVIGSRTAIGRVATCLLDMSTRAAGGGETFILPICRSEMADYLSLTIETVSRAMSRLKSLGIISLPQTNTVTIRDRAALQALAAEDGEGAARGRLCA
ncbi:Crp/Fnr family transcriptional regulator [Acuticoccus kandeliae]|uniref:Crp/Fnr family transcriptional regulator n=1 Tax=Acuticoccus kandeliae TaxID=2073160 RepID=UPI000D3E6908|nr:helix-turn-helix domain-containing protein [Acuticoccus kandeliae]